MNLRERIINDLKQLSYLLKEKYNQTISFRRLYEKANDEKLKDGIESSILISVGEQRNIFSKIPEDTMEYLSKMGRFNKDIFDYENKVISFGTYKDIFEVIECLLNILEFDLTQAYIKSDRTFVNLDN